MHKAIFSLLALTVLLTVTSLTATAQKTTKTKSKETAKVTNEIAVIETDHGTIEIEFYRKDAPKTVENFVQLAKRGFYNGVLFHRVISGFMIQGGDPTGTGSGGESIYGATFNDEIDKNSELYKTGYKRGVVAMANRGPNTNSSQFFIMHKDYQLPPLYTIFGRVTKGIETIDKIAAQPTAPGDRPKTNIPMKKVTIKTAD
ncbi:MAG: peptidylprolyl isomerase [Bacteroidia bacterium]|nr:peptidylprolyl isomerase [Bacteroidia bacterium]